MLSQIHTKMMFFFFGVEKWCTILDANIQMYKFTKKKNIQMYMRFGVVGNMIFIAKQEKETRKMVVSFHGKEWMRATPSKSKCWAPIKARISLTECPLFLIRVGPLHYPYVTSLICVPSLSFILLHFLYLNICIYSFFFLGKFPWIFFFLFSWPHSLTNIYHQSMLPSNAQENGFCMSSRSDRFCFLAICFHFLSYC